MQKFKTMNAFIAVLLLMSMLLSGCGDAANTTTEPAPLNITLAQSIPEARQGSSYDLTKLYVAEDGVEYSASASYIDPVTGEEVALKVKRMAVTQDAPVDFKVVITATSGDRTGTAEVTVPVDVNGDIMDKLLATDGAAGAADSSVEKTLNLDTAYVTDETASATSLKVSFRNPSSENEGTNLLTLSHYSLMAYYTSRVWDNVAVSFWVYNPMQQDVEFRLSFYDPNTEKSLFWDSEENTQIQYAKAGEWTRISFALHPYGIEKVLYDDPTGIRDDQLLVRARYAGADECTIYIDGVDIMPADNIEGLETGIVKVPVAKGDFTDLLKTCTLVNNHKDMELERVTTMTNDSNQAVRFGSNKQTGWPTFDVRFSKPTDITGYTTLRFDVYAKNAYPWVSVSVIYLDANGEEQRSGISIDYRRETWTSHAVNLLNLTEVDFTKVVGFRFSVNIGDGMVDNTVNNFYFDNLRLTVDGTREPTMAPALVEDDDLISGPMMPYNIKNGFSGVCKVAVDDEGDARSNSILLFWANNPNGYPGVYTTFMFDEPQDWSDYTIFSMDTHTHNAHYWMRFELITYDENGEEKTINLVNDAVLTQWMTNSIPLQWFTTEDGSKPDFSAIYGIRIYVDLHVNLTGDVGYIYLDNVYVS